MYIGLSLCDSDQFDFWNHHYLFTDKIQNTILFINLFILNENGINIIEFLIKSRYNVYSIIFVISR